jgi:protein SCO1/2
MGRSKLVWGACITLATASLLSAQYAPPKITNGVGLDQKLNAPIPLDDTFRNEANQLVPLRTYFGDKPVVLTLVYYDCPGLCGVTMQDMAAALKRVSLTPGKDYDVVIVSIDPKETPSLAAAKKSSIGKEFNRAGFNAGWHFLTGTQESISRLAAAVGFRYHWDERSKQFVHATGIMVVTPEGKLSRYFFGVQYTAPDVRLALVEASHHKIGSPVDYFVLYCCPYDPATGRYTLAILSVLKIAGYLTMLGLGALIFYLIRGNPKQNKKKPNWKEVKHAG